MADLTVSYFIKGNLYGGTCAFCGAAVAPYTGFVQKGKTSGKWETLCEPCVREHGRFLPRTDDSGMVIHSKSLGRGGSVPTGYCTRCGADVGLVKNDRGKWYLANAGRSANPDSIAWRVADWMPHACPDTEEPR
jgi:hypothetical protein